jgi:hypothetical protein
MAGCGLTLLCLLELTWLDLVMLDLVQLIWFDCKKMGSS